MGGGFVGILRSASLTSKKRAWAHNPVGQCSILARNTGGLGGCLAGEASSEGSRQEDLCGQIFGDPTLRRDGRQNVSRHAGDDRSVTAEAVGKLCREGRLSEAVEALEVLVHRGRCVFVSLFNTVLKKCLAKKDVVLGSRVHVLAVRKGYLSDTVLGNLVLRLYASHGRLQDAMDVLEAVAKPDVFSWSAIISAHVKQGRDRQAVELYHQMRGSGVKPDGHVFVAALRACARGSDLKTGQQVHADVLASGVEPDVFVSSCLVDMYTKCGSLEEAQGVFDGLGKKNVVTWTAMIAGYAQKGMRKGGHPGFGEGEGSPYSNKGRRT